VVVALVAAACGSSGPGSSTGTSRPKRTMTSSTAAPASTTTTTTSVTTTTTSGPMTTASLPVIVCNTTSGVATTTTSLPASVSVSVPASNAQAGNLAVYSDATGRLMLVGPLTGWTCTGSFGADGSGTLALTPAGTPFPSGTGTTWHLPASSPTQAIVATESGGSTVQGAALACPVFPSAQAATQQDLGKACPSDPSQERIVKDSSVEVAFEDPPGVAGIGLPSGGQNPANGVVLYQPKATEASAYLATCTMPAAQQDVCTAVLNHFVATFG
jgi:hypothetical protein